MIFGDMISSLDTGADFDSRFSEGGLRSACGSRNPFMCRTFFHSLDVAAQDLLFIIQVNAAQSRGKKAPQLL